MESAALENELLSDSKSKCQHSDPIVMPALTMAPCDTYCAVL